MGCCEYLPLSENLIYFIPPIQSSGEIWDENNVTKSQSLPAHDRWQSKLVCEQAGFFYVKSLTEDKKSGIFITVLHNIVIDGGKQLAKQIEGVYERIIEYARKEFLTKGYMDASLRTIAAQAGTTTGSIYTRFKDKEGLFEAIVGPHYDHIMSRFCQVQEEFAALPAEQQPENMGKVSGNCMLEILQYCYEHMEECQMLISKAEGTRYASFLDKLIEIESKATHKYLQVLEHLGNPSPPISPRLEHIIITGMFNTYLELVLHQMPWEEAVQYLEEMQAFYTAGWMKLMGQE